MGRNSDVHKNLSITLGKGILPYRFDVELHVKSVLEGVSIMVYVLDILTGQPLMPTDRHGKVKHLLKDGKVKVVKRCPFTIQLLYTTTTYTQEITLGVDAGSKVIGLSGFNAKKGVIFFRSYFTK